MENWIKWDLGSRLGLKMSLFVQAHGAQGYGLFVIMTENFYRATEHKISLKEFEMHASACKVMQKDASACKCMLVDLGLWEEAGGYLFSPRVIDEIVKRELRISEISSKRKLAADKRWAGIIKENNANALQTDAAACKPMQTDARVDKSRSDQNRSKRERDAKKDLVQIGKVLRMEAEELETCKRDFGEALLTQEVKEADLWLEKAETPNARKYRKPNHNHYLFFRNWLKDKRLKNQPNLNGRKPTTFELNPDIFGDVNL